MRARRGKSLGYRARATIAKSMVLAGIAVLALVLAGTPASAQNGIFDTILGRRSAPSAPAAPPVSAYADPFSAWNPFGSPVPQSLRPEMDVSVAYCVRLCDGRYFPIQRHAGISPGAGLQFILPGEPRPRFTAAAASSMRSRRTASATPTSSTAFIYREKLVRAAPATARMRSGWSPPRSQDDPTLRPGDIVATNRGSWPNGGGGRQQFHADRSPLTPCFADLRRKLTETKIAPATATAAPRRRYQAEPNASQRPQEQARSARQIAHHLFRQRERGGEPGRFDAEQVDEPRHARAAAGPRS